MQTIESLIAQLKGPILVLGASGFVGANLLKTLLSAREDVFGTASRSPAWRLADLDDNHVIYVDLLARGNLRNLINEVEPATVFDCIAYGAYSFETDIERIYQTNIVLKQDLIELLIDKKVHCYIHAGSSSEYGAASAAPSESALPTPNSHYAVTKNAASSLLYFAGKHRGMRCANLRLYSVYGPLEDRARLIPTVIATASRGTLPPFVSPDTSRDFVYVDDVTRAFVSAAVFLTPERYGESFNIGSGEKTTIRNFAYIAKSLLGVAEEPRFSTMPGRAWDVADWYANPKLAASELQWEPETSLEVGLAKTAQWYDSLPDKNFYELTSKKRELDKVFSVSVVVACYKDGQAIPVMADRLEKMFDVLGVDYEVIFVNDGSPDDSEEVIRALTEKNPRIFGITHSRNFGSQAAFKSGMQLATKSSVVLMDGDLQDPPELIPAFVEKWREGFDVVYGVRVKREAAWFMQVAYKAFYRVFNYCSEVPMPHDAGDFSLMDRRVMQWVLACEERDLFLRGLRSYVGFRQTGVPYVRPERMFGQSTNSLVKNFAWAKKGILSFSRAPLDVLTFAGVTLCVISAMLSMFEILAKLFFPGIAPKGITTVVVLIIFFGSTTILAISLVGEYVAKIFEEVKARPAFIRKNVVRKGIVRKASGNE